MITNIRRSSWMVMIIMIVLLSSCSKKNDQLPTGSGSTIDLSAVIIDHNCTDLSQIPDYWLERSKTDLKVMYGHTSHGSQLVTGMEALDTAIYKYFNDHYYYLNGAAYPQAPAGMLSFWDGVPLGDLGNPDMGAWKARTDTVLLNSDGAYAVYPHNRNLVMWSWCGQVSTATEADIDTYLSLMTQLELAFPAVKFVYMTGHLDGTGANGNLNLRNNQIRDYCRTNKKILFDFADIESYAPKDTVNFMLLNANDNCDYDSDGNGTLDGNWAVEWIAAHPDHELTRLANACGSCAHSQQLNCIMKGRALWWMMARLAGWTDL